LCATTDLAALWAARELAARDLQPLELVTAEALAYCRRFEHRVVSSRSTIEITLSDGRVIDGAAVRGTLNRLHTIPSAHLTGANAKDRQYAEQELFALYLSWLHALPGVMLNRPMPRGLSGEWRHISEWVWLAAQAGLLTLPYLQSDSRPASIPHAHPPAACCSVIAVNGRCCGAAAPPPVVDGCDRLLRLSGAGLLGIDFDVTPDGDWIFSHATPFPDLRLGGAELLDALIQVLKS